MYSFKIASRSSPLALAQIDEIIRDLKAQGSVFDYESIKFETAGDKDKSTPLTNSRDNFFTDTIDRALLEGKADIAIHSAKDLPQYLHEDLKIFALTQGLETQDAWVSRVHWKDLQPQAKVGTSSVLRQKQILQMRPDVTIVNIRGTIDERLQLLKEGKVDGIVAAVCALKRLKLEGEIKDIFPWEGIPLQGQLAVVGRQGDHELENLFSVIDVRRRYGKVILVGAGPGDCELITLKGIKALETADCVFYDYLVDTGLLKYAPRSKHIYAGKRKGERSLSQHNLSQILKEKAFAGQKVVRLKGGDPLIFGRGADEIQYLRSYHIEVEIIPGISSAKDAINGAPVKTFLQCGTHPDMYRHLGKIVHCPMIDIKPVSMSEAGQKHLLQAFESAEIIVLTSWYAGEYFLKELHSIKPNVNFVKKVFAVIGKCTQEALQKYNIKAAIMPQEATAQGLLKAMTQQLDLQGKRILFPRSSLSNPFLKDALSAHGAIVKEITIYVNTMPAKRNLPSADIDGVIFTSPSTVRNFLTDYDTIPASWQIMAKGPVTLKTLQEAGYHYAASLS